MGARARKVRQAIFSPNRVQIAQAAKNRKNRRIAREKQPLHGILPLLKLNRQPLPTCD